MLLRIAEDYRRGGGHRVLGTETETQARDQLFRHVAQLYANIVEGIDGEQDAQYDDVLCSLADLVEDEARAYIARILTPLDHAPHNVVLRLARDSIEVARPLLEFSNHLSENDLVEIATHYSDDHRHAIAGRMVVGDRISQAIARHGGATSIQRLVRNSGAELSKETLARLAQRARSDEALAMELRGRQDIDWSVVRGQVEEAGRAILGRVAAQANGQGPGGAAEKVATLVFNRLRSRAGFSSKEWALAYNQVKALSDRNQLDDRAITRFARFGYGHHSAAALAVKLAIAPEHVIKWLAAQDYDAVAVALKAMGVANGLVEPIIASLPWRDIPDRASIGWAVNRFQTLDAASVDGLVGAWRSQTSQRNSA
jgi:hypothetical protein